MDRWADGRVGRLVGGWMMDGGGEGGYVSTLVNGWVGEWVWVDRCMDGWMDGGWIYAVVGEWVAW